MIYRTFGKVKISRENFLRALFVEVFKCSSQFCVWIHLIFLAFFEYIFRKKLIYHLFLNILPVSKVRQFSCWLIVYINGSSTTQSRVSHVQGQHHRTSGRFYSQQWFIDPSITYDLWMKLYVEFTRFSRSTFAELSTWHLLRPGRGWCIRHLLPTLGVLTICHRTQQSRLNLQTYTLQKSRSKDLFVAMSKIIRNVIQLTIVANHKNCTEKIFEGNSLK